MIYLRYDSIHIPGVGNVWDRQDLATVGICFKVIVRCMYGPESEYWSSLYAIAVHS